jgi:Protein of unknown function (DUF3352)
MRASIRTSFLPATCALLALAGLLAGCGSSSSTGTSADPAGVTPAAATVYVGAVVRPSGSLQSNAQTAARKLTGQNDPYTRLLALLQTPGSPALDYSHDIAPWLGANAGLFLTSLGSSSQALTELLQQGLAGSGSGAGAGSGGSLWPFAGGARGPQGAIVLDTSDLAAAKAFVAGAAAHAHAHASSYRGVSVQATSAGDAFAVVDRFVVLGTEAGVHAVIDTSQSASASLKGDASYSQLQSVAPSGALGHVYANPSALGHSGARALGTLAGNRPLNVSLVPAADSIALDADAGPTTAATGASGAHGTTGASGSTGGGGGTAAGRSASGSGLIAAAAAGARALGELPGESWLAAGLGNVGATAGGSLSAIHSLLGLIGTLGSSGAGVTAPQSTLSVKGLLEGLLTPLSLLSADTAQARRDYLSWMGDAGVFASGTSVLELKGGVAIDSTDPAASRAAVAKLGAALRHSGAEVTPAHVAGAEAAVEAKIAGLPLALVIADGRGSSGQAKFVMGLGTASVQDALNPSSTMASSSAYESAAHALGEGIQPSIAVDFATLLGLLEGVGLSEDPTISPFLPYLRASNTLSGGGKSLGDGVERLRLVLGLQPTSESGSNSG